MGQFDNLLRCTLGGANFQFADYQVKEAALITQGVGRTGTSYRVDGKGWIEGTDAADYQAKVAAVMTAMRISGQDFSVYELNAGTPLYQIVAAQMSEGGPHVDFELGQQDSPLRREFIFSVNAKNGSSGGGGGGTPATIDTSTGPDALRAVASHGQVNRAGATAYYFSSVLAPFKQDHPATSWIISSKVSVDDRDTALTYELSATELRNPLPDNGAHIVDGEGQIEKEGDEQMRQTIRYVFDLLLSDGDYQPTIDLIRAEAAAKGPIMRESTRVTRYKQTRLQASFELLTSREGNRLTNWTQQIRLNDPFNGWKQIQFPGALPILVEDQHGLRVLVQSGSATGIGAPPQPALPLYPDWFSSSSPPEVIVEDVNEFEWRTTWNYVMWVQSFSPFELSPVLIAKLRRPAVPTFIESVAS